MRSSINMLTALLAFAARATHVGTISLSSTSNYTVLGATTISVINLEIYGYAGVYPETLHAIQNSDTMGGLDTATFFNGRTNVGNPAAMNALADTTAAYPQANVLPCTTNLTGQALDGLVLAPGVYCQRRCYSPWYPNN
jgi:hypothetical protein